MSVTAESTIPDHLDFLIMQPDQEQVVVRDLVAAVSAFNTYSTGEPLQISFPLFTDSKVTSRGVLGPCVRVTGPAEKLYSLTLRYEISAHLRGGRAMTLDTTLMAYSMSKTITAIAVLQLVERDLIDLDAPVEHYLPDSPYGRAITIRDLLAHLGGLPNPIPLRWVHAAREHATFNERASLDAILRANFQEDTASFARKQEWLRKVDQQSMLLVYRLLPSIHTAFLAGARR